MSSSDSSDVYYVLTIRSVMALGKLAVSSFFRISTDLIESDCVLVNTQ
jgi:hypothetical protein